MSNSLDIIKNSLQPARTSFEQVNEANGYKLNFFNEVEFAMQVLSNNDYLAKSTPVSLQDAIKNVALIGLSLNPVLKYAYLVPRKKTTKVNGKFVEFVTATLMPSYIGLCKILTDTGAVRGVSAEVVYEAEIASLDIETGIGGYAKYQPVYDRHPGKIVACYAKAILADGTPFIALMRRFEWEEVRNRSESYKTYVNKENKNKNLPPDKKEYNPAPVWMTDEKEMIRKTILKNMWKYLPKTDIDIETRIGVAISLDNDVNGINFDRDKRKPVVASKQPLNIDVLDNSNEENVKNVYDFIEKMRDGTVPGTFKGKTGNIVNITATISDIEDSFAENRLSIEKWEKINPFLEKTYNYFLEESKKSKNEETTDESGD